MQLDDLYRRVIMDHYKKPRNRGTFDSDAVTIELNNPTCGDRISLQLMVEDNKVVDARFTGEGCSISMSSASMMTDAVKGRTLEEAIEMAERFSSMVKGENVTFDEYEDLEALSGVCKFPARIKCATLAWNALRKGIEEPTK
ncbi:SUF system NifU family Fe-S cluster assembly protein [Paenibacillus melissococcoides]|uniref:SUF system NifU family Fe-S cluster assembly protein n=1 Tax=Paenibacillus melissococcoides TaxID=2912268 RepID=A0ABM9G5G4_9BACL|nr:MULTISPECIES: SUF system NifU family Fe-S cluster assembly protein [Paenibacillus]MEB9892657.1 SUF system NifU family Fe-S cluster assembly protein [Bacillus cereus]NKI22340.1 SUF system NifU family Fe-S cluster assembly protein [Paenibacillus dendritiformis]NRF96422.1 SUF system NifU family Fe-S cluster assembly protein [Paenibacillus dendritiformis]CAH8246899.1 SUF system NifU family Fe-S cluster assembly protein [Paenibacillus melissococcoides]CAH8716140.1 SUF system NifU family Fe-S clu